MNVLTLLILDHFIFIYGNFSLTKKGVPTYKISYKDQAVIKQSKLGLERYIF